jgi:universal stress protein A
MSEKTKASTETLSPTSSSGRDAQVARRLLIAVDLHRASAEQVIERAVQIAPEATRELVHVAEGRSLLGTADPGAVIMDEFAQRMRHDVEQYLGTLAAKFGIHTSAILEGHPASAIQAHATRGGHDLIVIGTHGRHGLRRILGATANGVLHGATCHVLAVRIRETSATDAEPAPYRRLLAAVDLSGESDQVLDIARRLSERLTAELDLLHVIKPFRQAYASMAASTVVDVALRFEHDADMAARKALRTHALELGLPEGCAQVRHGAPAAEIHAALTEQAADLLVIGSHGKHGVALLGSVANAALHGTPCDVLAVRVS